MPLRVGISKFNKRKRRFGGKRSKRRTKSRFVKRVANIAKAVTLKTAETQKSTQFIPAFIVDHNTPQFTPMADPSAFNPLRTTQGTANPDIGGGTVSSSANRIGDAVNGIGLDLRFTIEWTHTTPGAKLKVFMVRYRKDGTYPNATNFFAGVHANKWLDYVQTDRWDIMDVWTYRAPKASMTVNMTETSPNWDTNITKCYTKYIPWKRRVQYMRDGGTDPNQRPLFVWLAYNEMSTSSTPVVTCCTVEGTCRFYYKDP